MTSTPAGFGLSRHSLDDLRAKADRIADACTCKGAFTPLCQRCEDIHVVSIAAPDLIREICRLRTELEISAASLASAEAMASLNLSTEVDVITANLERDAHGDVINKLGAMLRASTAQATQLLSVIENIREQLRRLDDVKL